VTDRPTYVQNILQPSFVGPFNVVDNRHLHTMPNPALTLDYVFLYRSPWSPANKQRPRKTKNGTEVAHVTRDSDTTFKVKRSKVKVTRPLYSTREGGAVVTVRTYWAWETTATLRLLGGARGAGAPTGEGRGHIVLPRAQLVFGRIVIKKKTIFIHYSLTFLVSTRTIRK